MLVAVVIAFWKHYGTPEFHTQVRQAGINNSEAHPELFIKGIGTDS